MDPMALMAHGSHGSHDSHSSYMPSNIIDPQKTQEISTRNENSTPRQTVLPSSPAIAEFGSRKLKKLPGHSQLFKDAVQKVQVALMVKGYEVGEINGEMHSRTIAAIYEYQQDINFIPSGKLTSDTLASLGISI